MKPGCLCQRFRLSLWQWARPWPGQGSLSSLTWKCRGDLPTLGGLNRRTALAALAVRVRVARRRLQSLVLSSKLEILEILNQRRYKVITESYCMTNSDTGHQNFDGKDLCDFSLLSFNILVQILPSPRRSVMVHVVEVTHYSNADD